MPLILPEDGSRIGKICSIDPGTRRAGLAVYEIDVVSGVIVSAYAETYKSEKLVNKFDPLLQSHGERISNILAQRDNLKNRFIAERPFVIFCESPYFHHLHPGAFQALSECLFAFRTAATSYDKEVPFELITPSIVKSSVGAFANSNQKEAVREAISKIDEIMNVLTVDLFSLDEHSVDSLAVGYAGIKLIRKE